MLSEVATLGATRSTSPREAASPPLEGNHIFQWSAFPKTCSEYPKFPTFSRSGKFVLPPPPRKVPPTLHPLFKTSAALTLAVKEEKSE